MSGRLPLAVARESAGEWGPLPPRLWHHRFVSSNGLEHLARTAYEAHRGAHSESLPPWEDTTEQEQRAWKAAMSAVAGQTGVTLADVYPVPTSRSWSRSETSATTSTPTSSRAARARCAVSDEYASNHHARFQTAHGLWYVKDLASTNGTWLNGRRIHAPQRLKKGDKIKIGHTVVTVVSA